MKQQKEKSWGTLLNSQHYGGRKVCCEFKMKSTCTTKKKGRLVLVEWKWCDELSKDNFKHKFYTTHNLWEEAPLSSL
jgi:hypothetical protein